MRASIAILAVLLVGAVAFGWQQAGALNQRLDSVTRRLDSVTARLDSVTERLEGRLVAAEKELAGFATSIETRVLTLVDEKGIGRLLLGAGEGNFVLLGGTPEEVRMLLTTVEDQGTIMLYGPRGPLTMP